MQDRELSSRRTDDLSYYMPDEQRLQRSEIEKIVALQRTSKAKGTRETEKGNTNSSPSRGNRGKDRAVAKHE